MPILHDVLIGVFTVAVLVMLIAKIAHLKRIRTGKGVMTTPIFYAAVTEFAAAVVMCLLFLRYAESVDPIRLTIQLSLMTFVLVLALAFRRKEQVPAWVFLAMTVASVGCFVYSSI